MTATDAFAEVEAGSMLAFPASPVLGNDGAEVVRIAAPARAQVDEKLVVCGAVRLRHGRFGLASHASEAYVVAVDAATGEVRGGRALVELGMASPVPGDEEPQEEPALLGDGLVTTWFNCDLFEVLDLPRRPGSWYVHAFVRSFASNGVLVETVEAGA